MAATKKTFKEDLDALHKHSEWWPGYGKAKD